MLEAMSLAILIGAGLITVSVFTSVAAFRIGAPLLLVFLGIGLLAGEDGPGGIPFDDAPTAYFVGSLALAIILFDSGFHTRIGTIRAAAGPAVVLATLGVLLTALFVGAAAHVIMGIGWLEGFLLGAIVGSTDAAAVFFLLRVGGITIRERVRSTLEVESGSNDPMAIFLTVAVLELIVDGASLEALTWGLGQAFVEQMGIGLLAGVVGGFSIVLIVNRLNLEQGLYPIVVMSLALCLFSATLKLGGSGFLAAYVAGLVAGNRRLRAAAQLRRFQNGMTWLCQIGMFLILGLLATPSQFPAIAPEAIGVALFLILLGRPLAVWLCLLPFGFSRHETAFIAYVGLRGAVSILLAIFPILAGLGLAQTFFDTAFIIVLVSLLVQGWGIRPLARWLGLIVPPRVGPVDRIELELPGRGNHELVAYRVVADCPVLKGARIPRWARPSLIVRGGQSMGLHKAGRMQANDLVFIFIAPERVRLLDRLFASPKELESSDQEFYGTFALQPSAAMGDVAHAYGFEAKPGDENTPLAEVLQRELGGQVEVGDRVFYVRVEFIVRRIEGDVIAEVGLAIEPGPAELPIFPTWRDLRATLRRLLRLRPQKSKRKGTPPLAETYERARKATAAEVDDTGPQRLPTVGRGSDEP
ncbi:MAG: potassium/proton antiporter [Geminicoccaceae bacterium]|nr:MAG: potassium/proton antiporter [Geminicoccaceae bacterium]